MSPGSAQLGLAAGTALLRQPFPGLPWRRASAALLALFLAATAGCLAAKSGLDPTGRACFCPRQLVPRPLGPGVARHLSGQRDRSHCTAARRNTPRGATPPGCPAAGGRQHGEC